MMFFHLLFTRSIAASAAASAAVSAAAPAHSILIVTDGRVHVFVDGTRQVLVGHGVFVDLSCSSFGRRVIHRADVALIVRPSPPCASVAVDTCRARAFAFATAAAVAVGDAARRNATALRVSAVVPRRVLRVAVVAFAGRHRVVRLPYVVERFPFAVILGLDGIVVALARARQFVILRGAGRAAAAIVIAGGSGGGGSGGPDDGGLAEGHASAAGRAAIRRQRPRRTRAPPS